MTDTPTPGSNARGALRDYAARMTRLLDDKAAIDEDIKALKGEMKAASFGKDEMKAFAQIVKEMRKGPDYQADQLQLELVLDTYRRAVDLPTDLEVAQSRARAEAGTAPDDRAIDAALSDPALEGTSVSFGDGPYHELGPSRRKSKRGGLN